MIDYINKILLGDSKEILKQLPENAFDSAVTDPPYGIAFMSKKWDYTLPDPELWRELLRTLKPGGHALIFGGTRTFHRLAVNVEDSGFQIRDTIAWHYGEGFPKNMDISKQIDKINGATPEDKQWNGWGTALKPATELILLCRKPISENTVAANVLKHGTGAINIQAGRIGADPIKTNAKRKGESFTHIGNGQGFNGCNETWHDGRWPANLILDEYTAEILDEQTNDKTSRFFYVCKPSAAEKNNLCESLAQRTTNDGRKKDIDNAYQRGTTTRNNTHPTVKPITLIQYLINLITPPGGIVIDPFIGSGTTGIAARENGFKFTGIEISPEYIEIANSRLRQGYLF